MRHTRITVSVRGDTTTVLGFDNIEGFPELPQRYTDSNPFFYKHILKCEEGSIVCLLLSCSAGRYIIRAGDIFLTSVFDALLAQMRIAGDRLSEIRKSGKTKQIIIEI